MKILKQLGKILKRNPSATTAAAPSILFRRILKQLRKRLKHARYENT